VSIDLSVPERALAIGAHADDIEFGCGATLAKWADDGTEVHLLVLTDGSKGTWDAKADPRALVATRRAEQEAAAAALGVTSVEFLDAVDGELDDGLERRGQVCAAIRRLRPEVVLGHDPWKRYRLHTDHRYAGWLALDAIVAARDPHFFSEQGLPRHRPRHLLLFEADVVDHLELVDDHLDAKVAALLCHRSQWRSTLEIDGDDPEQRVEFAGRIRQQAEAAGREAGGDEGPAEAFKRLDDL
jgi:LmbE family N-acetylglucosaminyl deacetylase